ncbi:hypothetical protein [Candidatus Symbiopectobacterium sp. NZEC127]|uniref:hypothetical protein n=1 Tax=Candidatus Symbiopectobacterium sp. NZEC127 TaxID=2820472 RepID=UPI0022278DAB|nr:hypothetical protein [Candidatus Symbiopectobacterium sp. NZEC127]
MAGAFLIYSINDKRISDVLNGKDYDHYRPVGSSLHKTGFEIVLPAGVTQNGYLVIHSAKVYSVLYRGDYSNRKTITFEFDDRLIEQEGFDFLRIEYFDFKKKMIYVCEQQKVFKLWGAGSIVTITILPHEKIDEGEGDPTYCYEASIDKKIN